MSVSTALRSPSARWWAPSGRVDPCLRDVGFLLVAAGVVGLGETAGKSVPTSLGPHSVLGRWKARKSLCCSCHVLLVCGANDTEPVRVLMPCMTLLPLWAASFRCSLNSSSCRRASARVSMECWFSRYLCAGLMVGRTPEFLGRGARDQAGHAGGADPPYRHRLFVGRRGVARFGRASNSGRTDCRKSSMPTRLQPDRLGICRTERQDARRIHHRHRRDDSWGGSVMSCRRW